MGLALFLAPACIFKKSPSEPLAPEALRKIQQAGESIQAENFELAESLLQSLKELPPSESLTNSIQLLESRYWGKKFAKEITSASTLTATPNPGTIGQYVNIRLSLQNPGESPLRVQKKEAALVGRLQISQMHHDAYGNSIADRDLKTFSVSGPLEIPGYEKWEQAWSIPLHNRDGIAVQEYWVLCEIRWLSLNWEGKNLLIENLQIGPTRFRAFPQGYEPIAQDPIGSLQKALANNDERFDRHLLIAALLIPEQDRKQVVPKLVSGLNQASPLRKRALMSALRSMTGNTEAGFDQNLWTQWWIAHRNEYEPTP